MMYSKDCKEARLCPVSLGLALGFVSGISVLLWLLWISYYGVPPVMATYMPTPPTVGSSFLYAILALVKGFIFGFFLALFYDFFSSCCRAMCCRKDGTCDYKDTDVRK